jgi:amidase
LAAYLATRGAGTSVRSLKDVIDFNERNAAKEMPHFGQDLFLKAEQKGGLGDAPYEKALADCRRFSRTEGINAAMDKHQLDAILAPTGAPAWKTDYANGDSSIWGSSTYPAVAGYPHITVPAGFVFGLPVGLSIFGRPWSEGRLIEVAYAFERAVSARKPPAFQPPGDH